jgi:hypothetical protein
VRPTRDEHRSPPSPPRRGPNSPRHQDGLEGPPVADLPQPFTDGACGHSAVVVRVSSTGRHASPRPDEDNRRHPEPVTP